MLVIALGVLVGAGVVFTLSLVLLFGLMVLILRWLIGDNSSDQDFAVVLILARTRKTLSRWGLLPVNRGTVRTTPSQFHQR